MNVQVGVREFQIVVFNVADDEFCIPVFAVREIISISKLVTLPEMPNSMVGIIDVRGSIIPVIDLNKLFSMNSNKLEFVHQKVLLVEINDSLVGYLVDEVSEVLQVSTRNFTAVSQITGVYSGLIYAICKLEDRLIPLINVDKLLTSDSVENLKTIAQEEIECYEI